MDLRSLLQKGVHIWTDNALDYHNTHNNFKISKKQFEKAILISDSFNRRWGDLSPMYGCQWRDWDGIDQIQTIIDTIKTDPNSRRMILNAWNVGQLKDMILVPCHMMCQFYVRESKYLDCQLYQRSCDSFLGRPFNVASYSLLTYMIAHLTDLTPGKFIHVIGDCHVYENHIEAVKIQNSRYINPPPQLKINRKVDNIDDFKFEDFDLIDYHHYPPIKAKMAV